MRITDALEEFLLQVEANGRSVHSVAQYRRLVGLLVAWLAPEDDITALTPPTLARFLSSPAARETHRGTERKPGSMNALRGALKAFGAFLHDSGHLLSNPGRLIRRARCGPMPPKFLTADEQAQLLGVLRRDDGQRGRDYAWIHLGLASGLRISSVLGLRVEDLDLARGEALVRTSKGSRPSTVVLGREIAEHLGRYVGERTTGPLFNIGARHARRCLQQWCKRAGIRTAASPHTLRHSFAMGVWVATRDLATCQAALGHASITSTTVYARADQGRLREVLRA